jgi:hypothetical protein
VRVRRGSIEVEVAGTEPFVREMSEALLREYLSDADYEVVEDAPDVSGASSTVARFVQTPAGDAQFGMPTGISTFREMLNEATTSTVAEKVIMAGYLVMAGGADGFGTPDLARHFDSAYERQPNFPREIAKAAKAGWLMKSTTGDDRRTQFKLTHRGIRRVQELLHSVEGV